MAQNTPEACQPVPTGTLPDVGGIAVLHDWDFVRLAPALDLSTEEWLRVFQAHCGPPSSRRDLFQETLDQQLEWLSWGIYDDDPCPESMELSKRVEALPRILKLTIIDAIERFWTRESKGSSWDERLQHLGLRPCTSAHDRFDAFAHRRHVLPI